MASDRRWARVDLTPRVLLELLKRAGVGGFPDDARIFDVFSQGTAFKPNVVQLYIHSATFDEIAEGALCPMLPVTWTDAVAVMTGSTFRDQEDYVAGLIRDLDPGVLALLYKTLHDGIGLRLHQCDSAIDGLKKRLAGKA